MASPIFVSACLVGFRCRYDGCLKTSRDVLNLLEGQEWIPVCPEQYAGLPTPRVPMAFTGGTGQAALTGEARVVQQNGREVTQLLLNASRRLVLLGMGWDVKCAILKERSPSCGVTTTYVGDECVKGMGVFTAMLKVEGIEILSEETLGVCGRQS